MNAAAWTCECVNVGWQPDHRPCHRTFANGTVHWGMWCRGCGAFQSLPKAAVDTTVAEAFDPGRREAFREEVADAIRDQHDADWAAWRRWYLDVYLATPHWREVRDAVIARDALCVGCGRRPSCVVHHLTYQRLGCELLVDLAGMCRQCHERIHRHNRAMCPCTDCVARRGGQRVPAGMRVVLARPGYAVETEVGA